MAQRTIAAFFQSRPPSREALGDATNATTPVAFSDVSRKSNNDDAARTTTTPPPKRARVAAPLPFAKGADVMDVRGASSRTLGAQFCNVDGREILLCGDAWGAEDLTRPISKRWREPDESSRLTVNETGAADVRASPSGSAATACDDAVTARVGDVVIRGTNGLVARADGAVIRVYDASNAGAPPVASLCLAHDSVSSDASTCECTRRATRLDARAVTRMTSHRLEAESDTSETSETLETSKQESLFLRANLAATTAGGELVALAVRREKPKRVVATLLGRALLTEGTFQHAFPDLDGSLSLESRLGPFCMWRPKETNASCSDADGQRSGTIARFAVAASATGALCFITLAKTKPGDASYSEPLASRRAVATLDRVVSPHLPSLSVSSNGTSQGRARSVIHDVVTWTRRREEAHAYARGSRDRSSPRAAAVSVGGDGVLAITHFDAEDDALDTAWRVVPDQVSTKKKTAHKSSYDSGAVCAFVAVCDLSCTAVTMSAFARDATVWRLEDETEIRKVPLGGSGLDGENRLGRVSGLAIDTRGRLIAASFDDAKSGRGAVRVARGR
jgi:hypothetical protein